MNVQCVFCNTELDPRSSIALRRVHGWERKAGPGRRGGSDIVLREPGNEFACAFCIDNLKHGRSARQEGMF